MIRRNYKMRAETASNLEFLFMVSFSKYEYNMGKKPQFPLVNCLRSQVNPYMSSSDSFRLKTYLIPKKPALRRSPGEPDHFQPFGLLPKGFL